MIIGVNSQNQIKQVREITDTTLILVELDENLETYPFKDWSDTRILCYCYKQVGNVVSIYPYINTDIIEKLEEDDIRILQTRADIDYLSIMTGVDL
jgi:hypothetical protein